MRKLGISLYPEKSDLNEMKQYIDRVAELNFSRVFTSLLQLDGDKEEILERFSKIINYAKTKHFEVIVDVSPKIFEVLGISCHDLSFFNQIGADGIRLDASFSGREEAMMTFNPYGLSIEMNMSNDIHMIDTIMDYKPNRYLVLGGHNFYPHRYTGLSVEYLKKCTQNFKKYGIRTSAFISSNNKGTFGPWPVVDGLPTLECHRDISLSAQLKHYIAIDEVDDIIISNCYPSNEELDSLQGLDLNVVTFDVETYSILPEVENKILFEELHFNRGDINEYVIRSTQSRVKYKGHEFELFNAPDTIKRGDIIIESSLYGHYAGELQIALKDMKNSGKSNVVGHVVNMEHFILDCIAPWQKFKFRKIEGQ